MTLPAEWAMTRLQALISVGKKSGYQPQLLEAVLDVNKSQAVRMVDTAERKLGCLKDKTIAVLGLAFKPDTDDIREAPALKVIEALLQRGALVRAYDPSAVPNARRVLPPEVARRTAAEWATFADMAEHHLQELIAILDHEEPDYRT